MGDFLDFWIDALASLDQGGDVKPLCDLLRSDCELSPEKEVRGYLADMIERRCVAYDTIEKRFVKPKGRPRTPSYTISDTNVDRLIARRKILAYVQSGMKVDVALKKVEKQSGIPESVLSEVYRGGHASLRKATKKS
jgi:hypothetical protein